jgi:hypothetical protein
VPVPNTTARLRHGFEGRLQAEAVGPRGAHLDGQAGLGRLRPQAGAKAADVEERHRADAGAAGAQPALERRHVGTQRRDRAQSRDRNSTH